MFIKKSFIPHLLKYNIIFSILYSMIFSLRYFLEGCRPSQTNTHAFIQKYNFHITNTMQLPCIIAARYMLNIYMIIVKVHRVFPSSYSLSHLHDLCTFIEIILETVGQSLHHSCRTEITRQGILLP